ncbi:hypothetical protein [Zavarzinia compransoris]|uniref:Phasin domain-containing protein n=1 Tax=Zavarzinia compransoris TaxID=1264899 RepID=A0A317DZD6_9PROT|nr:hypothetical protein [Zavarzinia compransoris]PWR19781.1 hypothetical protein DKG75_15075 [Zavarzinia compransoris]TDP45115.1 hypothetical protein DES42_106337 [Zavarzinia compransoris]
MSETEALNPAEEKAFPFLQQAVLLDQARAALATLDKALALNADLWLKLSGEAAASGLPAETVDFVNRTATFTAKAAASLKAEVNDEVISKLIALNFNMSERILESSKEA